MKRLCGHWPWLEFWLQPRHDGTSVRAGQLRGVRIFCIHRSQVLRWSQLMWIRYLHGAMGCRCDGWRCCSVQRSHLQCCPLSNPPCPSNWCDFTEDQITGLSANKSCYMELTEQRPFISPSSYQRLHGQALSRYRDMRRIGFIAHTLPFASSVY